MPSDHHIILNEKIQSSRRGIAQLTAGFDPAIFWRNVDKSKECWEWTGSHRKGYGRFFPAPRRAVAAHRYSYYLAYGIDPVGLQVCHICDNPPCVRPEHLFLGTTKDNADDMVAKGRHRTGDFKGERNPGAKLSSEQVDEIRRMISEGMFNTTIAAKFGVHHALISRIRLGKAWTGKRSKANRDEVEPSYAIGKPYGSLTRRQACTRDLPNERSKL